jgi:fatty-acyl-CoA synthase
MGLVGSTAPPPSLCAALEEEFGIELCHAWGMTETSPLGSINTLTPAHRELPLEERRLFQTKQGRPPFGVEVRIVDEEGNRLLHDGIAFEKLQVQGTWVIHSYFKDDESRLTEDGWVPTGDIATIDPQCYIQITDRIKDLIKSRGEWISSIDVENTAMDHENIVMAAVIYIPDERWDERPLLIAVPAPDSSPSKERHSSTSPVHWPSGSYPKRSSFVDELPMGATGKVQKSKLREQYAGN